MARFSFYPEPEPKVGPMDFCEAGNHVVAERGKDGKSVVYKYDGRTWCPEHRAPSGDIDAAPKGTCEVGRIHNAPDGVWWLPAYQKYACKRHMGILVREIIRRSEFGK